MSPEPQSIDHGVHADPAVDARAAATPATTVPADGDATADATAATAAAEAQDELEILDQLEADLTAVDHAITTLDQISSDGIGGERAAAEISAAVSTERFGTTSPVGAESI